MRLSSSAIGRPNKGLLALVLMVIALTAFSMACQNSAGAANVVRITAPGIGAEGCDIWDHFQCLVVKLKPNSITKANTEYTVDLYEKGELRDTSYVSWSSPDLNMKNPAYVYFQLSNAEYKAYDQGRIATAEEAQKTGWYYTNNDLQDIFSVRVYEQTDEP